MIRRVNEAFVKEISFFFHARRRKAERLAKGILNIFKHDDLASSLY